MNTPILRLGLRSLFGRARVWLLIALPLVLIGLSVLLRSVSTGMTDADAQSFLQVFGIGIVVPVVTLLATTTLINSEFDDGSIIYLLTKPISRVAIIGSKATIVLGAALIGGAVPMGIAALVLVGSGGGLALAALVAGVVAAAAYVGIFIALATVMKRSILGCLLYWLIWESTISSLISPVKWLSARSWGDSLVAAISSIVGAGKPPVPALYAVLAALVALVAGVLLVGRRLAAMTSSDE
ncbi:ABC transporter permease [Leekyejoonella antrihumi]|uniref:ABC transporter permease n=1 Tax=Leekyejoonella antrihumi TaxID=1660198 RepID=A0A563DTQ8_9MICO|nr:ABC transporter permease [Leekyejoonella antrihumi]TWP33312.1 hypothetical protein FGL98_21705 [Leekyejoonella antrihumi]